MLEGARGEADRVIAELRLNGTSKCGFGGGNTRLWGTPACFCMGTAGVQGKKAMTTEGNLAEILRGEEGATQHGTLPVVVPLDEAPDLSLGHPDTTRSDCLCRI